MKVLKHNDCLQVNVIHQRSLILVILMNHVNLFIALLKMWKNSRKMEFDCLGMFMTCLSPTYIIFFSDVLADIVKNQDQS